MSESTLTSNPDIYFMVAPKKNVSADAAHGVLSNDVDTDGDTLHAVLVAGPPDFQTKYGTVVLNDDGSFVYTPTGGNPKATEDHFWYQAFDGTNYSDPTIVIIELTVKKLGSHSSADMSMLNQSTQELDGLQHQHHDHYSDWLLT